MPKHSELLSDPLRVSAILFRRLLLRLTGRQIVRLGRCVRCGGCCRSLTLEHHGTVLKSERVFEAIVRDHPQFARFKCAGRNRKGELLFACSALTKENLCSDYDNRPDICRAYPPVELYLSIGRLPSGCGYCFTTRKSFSLALKKQQRRIRGDAHGG